MSRTSAKLKINGSRICKCAGCGEFFSGLTYVDKHRKRGVCIDPSTLGLKIVERGSNTYWSSSESLPVGVFDEKG